MKRILRWNHIKHCWEPDHLDWLDWVWIAAIVVVMVCLFAGTQVR